MFLRENADTSLEILIEIPKETVIYVLEEKDNFAKTTYEEFTGWVNKDYIEKIEENKK